MADEQQTQRTRAFNPNDHLMQIKSRVGSKDYLPVQWRLVWFREQCPQGKIKTKEMEIDTEREVEAEVYVWNNEKRRSEKVVKHAKGYARIKAIITDGKGGKGTGTKSETAADFPDYVEKAETGAIGRALAALGYGTQFAPEFNEEHRIVDSPVERPHIATQYPEPQQVQQSQEAAEERITDQQASSIRKLCEHLRKAEPANLEQVSYVEAKRLIQQLTAEYRESRQTKKAS